MSNEEKQMQGGVIVMWLLAAPVRSFKSKSSGETKTVIELRDPMRLSNSLTVFLDGEAGELEKVAPRSVITLRVDEVRPGRGRGELVASVSREAVEAAFARVGGAA